MAAQDGFEHYYIDAFSGSGKHRSRDTGEEIQGSPLRALEVEPGFKKYFFIDLSPVKVKNLRRECAGKGNVHIYQKDCNDVLIQKIFPQVTYESLRRAFCFLDSYGMHYQWEVLEKAASMETIEVILNFPTMDLNMNALWNNPDGLPVGLKKRMNRFWGDDSWQEEFYEPGLIPDIPARAADDWQVVRAYVKRLKEKAGFKYVTGGIPVVAQNHTLYYLIFAGPNETGKRIVEHIFSSYKSRGVI
jgi:three-Cys-motif partner protein